MLLMATYGVGHYHYTTNYHVLSAAATDKVMHKLWVYWHGYSIRMCIEMPLAVACAVNDPFSGAVPPSIFGVKVNIGKYRGEYQ